MSRSARFPSVAFLLFRALLPPCRTPESFLPLNSARPRRAPHRSPGRLHLVRLDDKAPAKSLTQHEFPRPNRPNSNSAEPVDGPALPSHNAIRQTLPPPLQIRAAVRTAPSGHIPKFAPKS